MESHLVHRMSLLIKRAEESERLLKEKLLIRRAVHIPLYKKYFILFLEKIPTKSGTIRLISQSSVEGDLIWLRTTI